MANPNSARRMPDHCPATLRGLKGWLLWRYVQKPGEPKPRKVPYYASGGVRRGLQGSLPDRKQLVTFDQARAACTDQYDGLGLALMPEWGISALDLDGCLTAGELHPDVPALVAGTYAEVSPSGRGVRAFILGDLGDRKDAHAAPFGIETFHTHGFVTFTGHVLDECALCGDDDTVATPSAALLELVAARFAGRPSVADCFDDDPLLTYSPPIGLREDQLTEILDALDPDMQHDTWLAVGMALHHETGGEGFSLWDDWSATAAEKYPGSEALERRWESFGKRTGRQVTARYLLQLAKEHGAYVSTAADLSDFDEIPAPLDPPEKIIGESGIHKEGPPEPEKPAKPLRFPIIPAGEFSRGRHPGWLVKGLLPRAALAVIFGESGSGKSFVALDIGMAIARGIPWRGHRTRQGRVVYITAEGGGGFRGRLTAYARQHGIDLDTVPFGIINAAPNFLLKPDAIDVARAIQACQGAVAIFVDTLSQVMPGGNENAGESMGLVVSHLLGIHRATGALVLPVHHAGKDTTKGARGWSGLRAAADAEIEVLRMLAGRMIRVSKQKDGDDSGEWGFDLERIDIGFDEDEDIISSCVVVEAPIVATDSGRQRPLGKWERLAIEVITEFGLAQNAGIEIDAIVLEMVRRDGDIDPGKRDNRRHHARRAVLSLCQGNDARYEVDGDCLRII